MFWVVLLLVFNFSFRFLTLFELNFFSATFNSFDIFFYLLCSSVNSFISLFLTVLSSFLSLNILVITLPYCYSIKAILFILVSYSFVSNFISFSSSSITTILSSSFLFSSKLLLFFCCSSFLNLTFCGGESFKTSDKKAAFDRRLVNFFFKHSARLSLLNYKSLSCKACSGNRKLWWDHVHVPRFCQQIVLCIFPQQSPNPNV